MLIDGDNFSCDCGWTGTFDDLDSCGACDGCAFCPWCNTEFDTLTGKPHEPGKCCLDVLTTPGPSAPGVCDTQTDQELLEYYKLWASGKPVGQQRLF
jgi:hypothetical protein